MGDEDQRLALHPLVQALAQQVFAGVVHGAGGFVEHQDWRVEQQCAGQQYGLALAAGQQLAAFAYRAVEALRMLAGQVHHAGKLGDFEHARVADVTGAEGQVVAQAAGQQWQVVGDVADLMAQVGDVELAQVEVVEQDLPFVGAVEGHQQSRQGALARTAATDDAEALASAQAQADVVQRRCALARVGETDLPHLQSPLELGTIQRPLLVLTLLRQSHQGISAGHGQACLLITGDQPGDLSQWGEDAAAEHVAGRRQEQEWRGRQYGQEDADDPECHA